MRVFLAEEIIFLHSIVQFQRLEVLSDQLLVVRQESQQYLFVSEQGLEQICHLNTLPHTFVNLLFQKRAVEVHNLAIDDTRVRKNHELVRPLKEYLLFGGEVLFLLEEVLDPSEKILGDHHAVAQQTELDGVAADKTHEDQAPSVVGFYR